MADIDPILHERSRETPVIADVDVLVAGGGPAGFAAALSSAREGARTMLVERFGYLGGMMTGCHVVWVLGCGDGDVSVARGITLELRERLAPLDGVTNEGRAGDYRVDAEVLKWQMAEMLEEAGVAIRLHTLTCDPVVEDNRVAGAFVESKSGRQAIRARLTVDATADADLAWRAGCPCDDQTHDMTLRTVLAGVDKERVAEFRQAHPDEYMTHVEESTQRNGGCLLGRGRHLPGHNVADPDDLTKVEILLRREAFDALYYLRKNMPGYENARIADTSPQIGVRLGRRVKGVETITGDDMRASRRREDSIGRLGVAHFDYKNYAVPNVAYDVPYGCLVPESIDGLLIAGRCVSCDYEGGDTMRLIVPCFVTGQAAGASAAIATRNDCSTHEMPIDQLQDALRRQGVYFG